MLLQLKKLFAGMTRSRWGQKLRRASAVTLHATSLVTQQLITGLKRWSGIVTRVTMTRNAPWQFSVPECGDVMAVCRIHIHCYSMCSCFLS
jgi:precorrin-4 methylase